MALVGFSFMADLSLPRGPLPIWYAKQKEYRKIDMVINATTKRTNSKRCYACQEFSRENR